MTPELREALDAHRHARAGELFDIAGLLEDHSFTADAGPVREAAQQCLGGIRTVRGDLPDVGRTYWGYEISDLKIALEPQRHCRPRGATMESVTGSLTVRVEEYVPPDQASVGAAFTHLRRLDTDFSFDASLVVDGDAHTVRSAWHLDTHLFMDTVSHAVHPRFHFQVGGERLDDLDHLIRGVFMPETPRMPVAPLDGILAIDFVLAHYCGGAWGVLRDMDASYKHLRKAPMQRYWAPYFRTLCDGIDALDTVPHGGDANPLIPNIFC
ncbi:hypothetical protein [Caulobacter sp. LjRoot300]|uniref:hypothetical protein n=1 Tax=Caulobacter sp. LjRoot300 TaxID=3342321 RepID=UPI003ECE7F1F